MHFKLMKYIISTHWVLVSLEGVNLMAMLFSIDLKAFQRGRYVWDV